MQKNPAAERAEARRARRWLMALGLLVAVRASVAAPPLEFSLHKNVGALPGPTLLIIGGIQGDEPGGFNAASLLVTHYRLRKGTLWVVPNLNFESIVRRSRGVHGDMNRKFPTVPAGDPDYARVERIKRIITAAQVDYVFNLHDGSGFFRHRFLDRWRNPRRWGQSIIIDQESMDSAPHAPLGDLARAVSARVNRVLIDVEHEFNVKNTRTRDGNEEMSKTLTYFAINEGKPAVGLETSKSLSTHLRVYYHLRLLEAYMNEFGIEFERSFALTPAQVRSTVDNNVKVAFYDKRLYLDMVRVRRRLRFVPLKKDAELHYEASSPLVAIVDAGDEFRVSYGNRRITKLQPEFFDYDASLSTLALTVDGERRDVELGSVVEVLERFVVDAPRDYRVNVIGWRRAGVRNESGVEIRRGTIARRFSVDKDATTYRVEVYRGERFCGMVLVRFSARDDTTAFRRSASSPVS